MDDQKFIEEALPQLQDYLLARELYWNLGGDLPRLTPGSLLLALTRLEAVNRDAAWKLRQKLEAIQARWRSAWEKKAAHETENRLRLWAQFLEEQADDEGLYHAYYAASVRERVILQLLGGQTQALDDLDALLRARFKPGQFTWEAIYESVFSPDEFWFLYGSL